MKDAHEITRDNANRVAVRSKRLYDSKVKYSTLLPGDRVLVRNFDSMRWFRQIKKPLGGCCTYIGRTSKQGYSCL